MTSGYFASSYFAPLYLKRCLILDRPAEVLYGKHSWPSHSIWLVPGTEGEGR